MASFKRAGGLLDEGMDWDWLIAAGGVGPKIVGGKEDELAPDDSATGSNGTVAIASSSRMVVRRDCLQEERPPAGGVACSIALWILAVGLD